MSIWTDAERAAWLPPEDLTVSEWADRYRILPPGTSSEPGPWRTERTPYIRAIQDAMGSLDVEEVVFVKSPQVGGSEATRNALGYWIDQDPGPCLIVYPSEQAGREVLDERVLPMLKSTPRLERYLTGAARDLKLSQVTLRTMQLYTGHAGSPQSLATRPCRYVICDEVDKYPPFSGKEADPVSLAEARTRTYEHRRKLILVSTPTTRAGLISLAYDACPTRLRYHVRCPLPECGAEVQILWPSLRWATGQHEQRGGPVPDDPQARHQLADKVQTGEVPVWFECPRCHGRVTENLKHRALAAGRWLQADGTPFLYRTTKLGFQISSLYSPWVTWSRVVAEFLRSFDSLSLAMNFANNWKGEPYEETLAQVSAEFYEEKGRRGARRGVCPSWAKAVIVSADAGGDHVWYTVRCWGAGYRSQLLEWGRVWNLEDLEKVLRSTYPVEDNMRPPLKVDLMVIDTGGTRTLEAGSRTDEIYRFTRRDPRIAALKGATQATGMQGRKILPKRITYHPPGASADPYDIVLNLADVGWYKDVLVDRLAKKVPGDKDTDLWRECQGIDDEYKRQMVSEERVLIREGRKMIARWQPIAKSAANHFWDCAVYQCVAADMLGIRDLGEIVVQPTDNQGNTVPQAPQVKPQALPGRPPGGMVSGRPQQRGDGRSWISRR